MREMKILCLMGLVVGVVLAAPSCNNFTDALDECIRENRCDVPPDGGDGGQPIERDGGCLDAGVDIPDDFDDINCDGIDGNKDEAIFVDHEGSASGDGTPERPFRTLAEALEIASLSRDTKKAIYIAGGPYTEENLNISFPISLYGNYGGVGSWTRLRTRLTTITGGPDGLGLTIRGVDAGVDAGVVVLIDRLTIRSATNANPGAPSIAMRVVDSQGILLRNVNLIAGAGANGSGGTPGAIGGTGARGGDGSAGDATTNPRAGGAGGAGLGRNGGAGGIGGDVFDNQQDGVKGDLDTPKGIKGARADVNNVNNCGTAAGGNGSNGTQGDTGTAGTAGNGIGALSGETWVAHSGGSGGPGLSGNGGGGGGGGARCVNTSTVPTTSANGGGGGGGGAGGTGGTGGAGGRSGGASIGLLLVRGQVRLEGGTVSGGQGGNGGSGGDGGSGGSGGSGGNGGNGEESSDLGGTVVARGGKGGNGGRGGDGGRGGAGGGGGGGPSIGIWCDSPTTSSFITVGADIRAQNGGVGGPGGNPGSPGEARPTHNCPP